MIFRRRQKPPIQDRLREILYPRKGVWRGLGYIGKRIRRLPDTPHRIALGFACGTVASFTPLFGFHFFVAAGLAWLVRGNMLAGAFGTIMGNPLSFPFIAAASLYTGWWITGTEPDMPAEGLSFSWLVDNVDQIFVPYFIGGIGPGLITAVLSYYAVGSLVDAYQKRRRAKIEAKAADRRAAIEAALLEQEAYQVQDAREGDNA